MRVSVSDTDMTALNSTSCILGDNEIYLGDARHLIKRIHPESVALSFWSPPYYVGKSYEKTFRLRIGKRC